MSVAAAPAAPPVIYGQVETIDPEFAELLLGKLVENRHVRSRKCSQFAADMRAGNWHTNGEAIKLTPDGRVIDGEHRLLAVLESGATIRTFVVYNVPEETRISMDSGSPRNLADHLRFLGHGRTAELATTLTVLWDRRKGRPRDSGRTGGVSKQQYLDLLAEHPNITESITAVGQLRRRLRIPMGIAAALHYDTATLSADDCAFFWEHLDTGANLREKDPIRALRKRLLENAASRSTALEPVILHAYIIKAWNYYREGKEVNHIMWRRGGSNPEDFPVLM